MSDVIDLAMTTVEQFCDRHGMEGAYALIAAVAGWSVMNGHSGDFSAAIALAPELQRDLEATFDGVTRQ